MPSALNLQTLDRDIPTPFPLLRPGKLLLSVVGVATLSLYWPQTRVPEAEPPRGCHVSTCDLPAAGVRRLVSGCRAGEEAQYRCHPRGRSGLGRSERER